jgi:hypothetical protein
MRNLFRRASFLFWQHPILWLPIVIVDPLVLYLNLLDKKLTHAIIFNVVTRYSVLGAPESTPVTSLQTLKILFLTKPIDWGTHFISLCLYTCAMIAIFNLISALRLKQDLSRGTVLGPVQKSFTRLTFFSLKLLITIGIAAIPFIALTITFVQRNGALYVSTKTFGNALSTIFFSAIAYLFAPTALKLLRPENSETPAPETRLLAKISAVLTFIASAALYFLAEQIEPSFISRTPRWNSALVYETAASLVSATPYIVLFIALSLLANDAGSDDEFSVIEPELT